MDVFQIANQDECKEHQIYDQKQLAENRNRLLQLIENIIDRVHPQKQQKSNCHQIDMARHWPI